MIDIYEQSRVWRKATHLTLQLQKMTQGLQNEAEERELKRWIRRESKQLLQGLERGLLEPQFAGHIDSFRGSLEASLKLRRELLISRYLGYLEEDSFESLEKEISGIIEEIHRQLGHLEYLSRCLNTEIAYVNYLISK